MNHDAEREAITEAMRRLFAGTPLRSSGNLDILTLAEEAGLKRNKLTPTSTLTCATPSTPNAPSGPECPNARSSSTSRSPN